MPPESETKPRYRPEVFNVQSLAEAKQIILTPEDGTTTDSRWEAETAPTAAHIAKVLEIAADDLVLDFGCGVGRIAKELIDTRGCSIIGADISLSMIQLAPAYTNSVRFSVLHPGMIEALIAAGLRFNSAYAVWTLQHCARPDIYIALIARAPRPGGKLYVLNTKHRCVPMTIGWVNDGKDMIKLLRERFGTVDVQEIGAKFPVGGDPSLCFHATCTL